jgi:hypothetical protein
VGVYVRVHIVFGSKMLYVAILQASHGCIVCFVLLFETSAIRPVYWDGHDAYSEAKNRFVDVVVGRYR